MKRKAFNVLHVMHFDKFIAPFIDFVEAKLADFDRHLFFLFGRESLFPVRRRSNVVFGSDFQIQSQAFLALAYEMNRAQKIILHGLFHQRVIELLALQPWLLKKCYWIIWGGDLYDHAFATRTPTWHWNEQFRRFVIKRAGHLVSFVRGDFELARKWYDARGEYHHCIAYPSNVFRKFAIPAKSGSTTSVQIGNSADPSNEHLEVLRMLEKFAGADIRVYAPLGYGGELDEHYTASVIAAGKSAFGDRFVAMTDFLPFDEYLNFLGKIDVAIFNHRRQQGLGNIITLIGLGKKIYLRSDVTSSATLREMGLVVHDIANLDLVPDDRAVAMRNQQIVEHEFSERELAMQLSHLFED
jgi:dTDP-N-acetylfucosamine:lipid II N-acetylfucosaminyltransferase